MITIPNPKGKKTISILVRGDYPVTGTKAADEIVEFFQYALKNASSILLKYPKIELMKKVLNFG